MGDHVQDRGVHANRIDVHVLICCKCVKNMGMHANNIGVHVPKWGMRAKKIDVRAPICCKCVKYIGVHGNRIGTRVSDARASETVDAKTDGTAGHAVRPRLEQAFHQKRLVRRTCPGQAPKGTESPRAQFVRARENAQ